MRTPLALIRIDAEDLRLAAALIELYPDILAQGASKPRSGGRILRAIG